MFRFRLTLEYLEKSIIAPYQNGETLMLDGRIISPDEVWQINIKAIDQLPSNPSFKQRMLDRIWYSRPQEAFEGEGLDVTDEFITGPPGTKLAVSGDYMNNSVPPASTREVFVVHGRNLEARDALFEFLRAIDLHPMEWADAVGATRKTSPYIGEILDAAFSKAHAVVVLFTPDDEARLRQELRRDSDPPHETELTGQARPNVLFEAGMAMGRSQDRTILVELGNLRPFSDVGGRHTIRLDNSSQRRQELAQRLQTSGCQVNLAGTDWHAAGDFDVALSYTDSGTPEIPHFSEQEESLTNGPGSEFSEDAKELLAEVAKDFGGEILKLTTLGGICFRTNNKHFGEMGDRRSEARWEGAVQDLLELGFLIVEPGSRGNLFKMTREGYTAVDDLE